MTELLQVQLAEFFENVEVDFILGNRFSVFTQADFFQPSCDIAHRRHQMLYNV